MHGLYPIVDVDTLEARGISVVDFAERVLTIRPACLQLRAKQATSRDFLALARRLRPSCRASETRLFLNDRVDLAVIAGADGVHVGQHDIPVAEVRKMAPSLRVGVSTHDLEQLRVELGAAPDYAAFGPVFTTTSKLRPDPVVGLERLAKAAELAHAGRCPLVAIGGIDADRAPEIARLGVMGAVIGALVPPEGLPGVSERARALHLALGGAE